MEFCLSLLAPLLNMSLSTDLTELADTFHHKYHGKSHLVFLVECVGLQYYTVERWRKAENEDQGKAPNS